VLEIAIVLLQMVLPQKQSFGPRDLAVPGHCGVEPPASPSKSRLGTKSSRPSERASEG